MMNNLLTLIAILLVIGWATGFLIFNGSGLIHLLLLIAIIAILLRVIIGRRQR